MVEAYKNIARICQGKGKYAGIHFTEVDEVDLIEKLINEFRYQLIILGRDKNFNDGRFIELMRYSRTFTEFSGGMMYLDKSLTW